MGFTKLATYISSTAHRVGLNHSQKSNDTVWVRGLDLIGILADAHAWITQIRQRGYGKK